MVLYNHCAGYSGFRPPVQISPCSHQESFVFQINQIAVRPVREIARKSRKRQSQKRYLLDWLKLEERLQPTAVIVPASDGTLIQAPVIESVNGVLSASMNLVRAGAPGGTDSILYGNYPLFSNSTAPAPSQPGGPPYNAANYAAAFQFTLNDGTVLPAQFPAPTLKLKQGDTLDLDITNSLGVPNSAPTPDPERLPTNFHVHGFIVSPLGTADNIYRVMDANNNAYQTSIPVPDDQQSGIGWYHPHKHGYSADQVYAGLAGFMQVGDPLDAWPGYIGQYQEKLMTLTMANKEQVGTDLMLASPKSTSSYSPNGGWQKYVNGQLNPTMTMQPGETQIWTLGATVRNGSFNLGITDFNGQNPWQSTILSYDGNSKNVSPLAYSQILPSGYTKDGVMAVDPGERVTMAVTAPTTPGIYYLVDNLTPRQTPASSPFAIMTIVVTGPASTQPTPVFTTSGTIPDLFDPNIKIDQHRTFNFSLDNSGPGGTTAFKINGYTFPNGPMVTVQAGQVEEWLLTNTTGVDHPFHLHQNDIAVISINGQSVSTTGSLPYPYISLRDTVNIPAGGTAVIRFRASSEVGKFVFHCHILPHEDSGMMMSVLAGPNADERRVALGAGVGQGGGVLVQGGYGEQIGKINPLPKSWNGGVATATGLLTSDLTEDIVAGPAGRGSRGEVTVYDGSTLSEISRFNPFPDLPRSGVSLAVADVDQDGKGEIIVGRVGAGQSLVRIFRLDGTLFREIKGALPGYYPNGVTVAGADFNGDNFDDVAIGAGKGRLPLVVGLDGYSLSLPTGVEEMIFSFTAPGRGRSGVNLAGGYLAPATVPSFLANLATTPASGPDAGKVSVWNMESALSSMMGMMGMTGMSSHAAMSQASSMPTLMATLTPFGKRPVRGGLRLAISPIGSNGQMAIAEWASAHQPVYQSISYDGVISTVNTPTPMPVKASAMSARQVRK